MGGGGRQRVGEEGRERKRQGGRRREVHRTASSHFPAPSPACAPALSFKRSHGRRNPRHMHYPCCAQGKFQLSQPTQAAAAVTGACVLFISSTCLCIYGLLSNCIRKSSVGSDLEHKNQQSQVSTIDLFSVWIGLVLSQGRNYLSQRSDFPHGHQQGSEAAWLSAAQCS